MTDHKPMKQLFTIGKWYYGRKYATGCTCGWRSGFDDNDYVVVDKLKEHIKVMSIVKFCPQCKGESDRPGPNACTRCSKANTALWLDPNS
jgi:hypothetical protein